MAAAETGPFDWLPFEMLEEIFGRFELSELKQLRLVNRRFSNFIQQIVAARFVDLVVKPFPREPENRLRSLRWYNTERFASQQNCVSLLRFVPRLRYEAPERAVLLKRLRITTAITCSDLRTLSADLNQLTNLELERLELDLNARTPETNSITLDRLQVLRIATFACPQPLKEEDAKHFVFNSTNLRTVCFDTSDALHLTRFSHFDLVEHLELNQLDERSEEALLLYASMHTLICNALLYLIDNALNSIRRNDPAKPSIIDRLLQQPTLTQLHLGSGSVHEPNATMNVTRDELIPIRDRINLLIANRPNLTICILGVAWNQVFDPLNGVRLQNGDSIIELHFRNQDQLANSFPSCSTFRLQTQLIQQNERILFGPNALNFHAIYPFIESVIVDDRLVAQLLFQLAEEPEEFPLLRRFVRFFDFVLHHLRAAQLQDVDYLNDQVAGHQRMRRPQAPAGSPRIALQPIRNLANRAINLERNFEISAVSGILLENDHLFVRCENWLLNFLGNIRHLVSLTIHNFGISQRFLDQLVELPGLTGSLESLTLLDNVINEFGNRLVHNLPVLFRFEELHWFQSNLLTDELTWQFINHLKCPAYLRLSFQAKKLTVRKYRNADASIRFDYELLLRRPNFASAEGLMFDELIAAVHTTGRLDEDERDGEQNVV